MAFAALALAACDDSFTLGGPAAPPLTQASMAGGTVLLVPPPGYCIDRRNLRQRFAIMARCDTLAEGQSGFGRPIGILTASFSPATTDALPSPQITATALGLENVSAARNAANAVVFRAEAPPTIEGMSATHWRGTARIGNQIMGLALYGPADGRALTGEGRALLSETIRSTSATP